MIVKENAHQVQKNSEHFRNFLRLKNLGKFNPSIAIYSGFRPIPASGRLTVFFLVGWFRELGDGPRIFMVDISLAAKTGYIDPLQVWNKKQPSW